MLNSIVSNVNDGVYRSLPEDSLVYVNESFAKIFGYKSVDEILQISPSELYAEPKDRLNVKHILLKEGQIHSQIFRFKRKDGSIFQGAMSCSITTDLDGRKYYDGVITDATRQMKLIRQIQSQDSLLVSINKNITEGIYRSYEKGGLVYVNKAFAQMFGYGTADELLKCDSLDLYADPDQRRNVKKHRELMELGSVSNMEILFKRKDGSFFWGMNNFILTKDQDGNAVYDGAIRDISAQKEHTLKLEELNKALVEKNKLLALNEQELETFNEELRSNSESLIETLEKLRERNLELDQIVYHTSHDLRSPLRSVLGLTNLMKLEKMSGDLDYINKIEERIYKMDDFIKEMLDYSRANRMSVQSENFCLAKLIDESLRDLEFIDHRNLLEVRTNFRDNVSMVESDILRLRIIISNIISNAFKYWDPKKAKHYLNINVNVTKHTYEIEFEDNGLGISSDHLPNIFEMFYRANDNSDGSGLGMYIVKQAISKLKGSIEILSELGKWTRVTMQIPM